MAMPPMMALVSLVLGASFLTPPLLLSDLAGQQAVAQTLDDRQAEIDRFNQLGEDLLSSLTNQYGLEEFQQALILSRAIGDRRREAISLRNLGHLYSAKWSRFPAIGDLEANWQNESDAIDHYRQAIAIFKASGADREVAATLDHLAEFYAGTACCTKRSLGLDYYQQALDIYTRLGDRDAVQAARQNIAGLHWMIADIYFDTGNYQLSLRHHREALKTVGRTGAMAWAKIMSLSSIGDIYAERDRPDEALAAFSEAFESLRSNYLGDTENHTDIPVGIRWNLLNMQPSHILRRIGNLYHQLHQESKALKSYHQALEKAVGINLDHERASILVDIGTLHRDNDRPKDALRHYEQALSIAKTASVSGALARLHARLQNDDEALRHYQEAIEQALMASRDYESASQPDWLLKRRMDSVNNDIQALLTLGFQFGREDSSALTAVYESLLLYKNSALDSARKRQELLAKGLNQDARKALSKLNKLRAQLASRAGRGQPPDRRTIELMGKIDDLEGALLERARGLLYSTSDSTDLMLRGNIHFASLQRRIPARGAMIEFLKYQPYDVTTSRLESSRYLAFVVLPQGGPQMYDLGEASITDLLIKTFRERLNRFDSLDKVSKQLYQQLLEPLQAAIADAEHWLIAPDSDLNLLPFAALIDPPGRYLLDRYLITYLNTGRDLLPSQVPSDLPERSVIVADPSYGASMPQTSAERHRAAWSGLYSAFFQNRSIAMGGLVFQALPGTAAEATSIASGLPGAKVLQGQQATEAEVKQLRSPRVLHIATHGFFLPDHCDVSSTANGDSDMAMQLHCSEDEQWSGLREMEHPMLRSGLALANANMGMNAPEDGILTAFEVAGMDLQGTQLVVLSACETGLGTISNGDGVYGMRRAFSLAGSESQVMSLWRVDDNATKELMIRFYENLQSGQGRGEALRQAQRSIRSNPIYMEPFYWAAFIPAGDWRSLPP